VQNFNVKPRDHEMPFSEDTCLDFLIISEENCAVFSFHGGMEIVVECSKLRFRADIQRQLEDNDNESVN